MNASLQGFGLVALLVVGACSTSGVSTTAGDGGAGAAGIGGSGQGGSGGKGGSGGGSGAAGAPGLACESDSDCSLHGDCCRCEAVRADATPEFCEAACDVTPCEGAGVVTARCLGGQCAVVHRCREEAAGCVDPPSCASGTLPVLGPTAGSQCAGIAWTGDCASLESCDFIPSCAECPGGTFCLERTIGSSMGTSSTSFECRPFPPGCGASPTCECAGALCGPSALCTDGAEGIACAVAGS